MKSNSNENPILIKLGGSALQNDDIFRWICRDLATLSEAGVPIVILHGGGPFINKELLLRGFEWEFHEGQRITTPEMMEVIKYTLSGKVNRRIVLGLHKAGVNAAGITLLNSDVLRCSRLDPKLGEVGFIHTVNTNFITPYLIEPKRIPVIAPLGTDEVGQPLNINADWAACRIAEALGMKRLVYLTDQDGIYDANQNPIPLADRSRLETLIKEKVVQGGMLVKVRAILDALTHGVSQVHILNGKRRHSLLSLLLNEHNTGTVCKTQQAEPSLTLVAEKLALIQARELELNYLKQKGSHKGRKWSNSYA